VTATRAGRPQGCLVRVRGCWLSPGCLARIGRPAHGGIGGRCSTSPDGAALGLDSSLDESSPSDRFWSHGRINAGSQRFSASGRDAHRPRPFSLDAEECIRFDHQVQAFQQAIDSSIRSHPRIQYGLEQFPSWKDCGTATCCAGLVAVQPAPNHSTDIQNSIGRGVDQRHGLPGGRD